MLALLCSRRCENYQKHRWLSTDMAATGTGIPSAAATNFNLIQGAVNFGALRHMKRGSSHGEKFTAVCQNIVFWRSLPFYLRAEGLWGSASKCWAHVTLCTGEKLRLRACGGGDWPGMGVTVTQNKDFRRPHHCKAFLRVVRHFCWGVQRDNVFNDPIGSNSLKTDQTSSRWRSPLLQFDGTSCWRLPRCSPEYSAHWDQMTRTGWNFVDLLKPQRMEEMGSLWLKRRSRYVFGRRRQSASKLPVRLFIAIDEMLQCGRFSRVYSRFLTCPPAPTFEFCGVSTLGGGKKYCAFAFELVVPADPQSHARATDVVVDGHKGWRSQRLLSPNPSLVWTNAMIRLPLIGLSSCTGGRK